MTPFLEATKRSQNRLKAVWKLEGAYCRRGKMRFNSKPLKKIAIAAACTGLLSLAGCGGVQFEGKVFDALGVSGEQKPQAEAKVPDRAPLILPPKRELPPPGSRDRIASPQNWPQDPDELKKQVAVKEKEKDLKCGEYDFKRKSSAQDFEEILDPLERCKGFFAKKGAFDLATGKGDKGSPDTVVNMSDDLTTQKTRPTPWRNEVKKAEPASN